MRDLLNRMLVSQKLVVLGVLALLLAVVPSALYIGVRIGDYRFAKGEADGLAPSRQVLAVLRLTQQHRGLAAQVLTGRADADLQRANKQQEADQAISKMEAEHKDALANAKVNEAWRTAAQEWKTLSTRAQAKAISAAESLSAHGALSERWLRVLEQLRDESGLSLDPSADAYYLHVATLISLPDLTESLGRLRATGATILGAGRATPEQQSALLALSVGAQRELAATLAALDKAFANAPGLKPLMASDIESTKLLVGRAMRLTDELVARGAAQGLSAADYYNQYTEAIDGTFKLIDPGLNHLGGLLSTRLGSTGRAAAITTVLTLLLLTLGAFFGFAMARSITRSVGRLQDVVQKFAAGDDAVRAELGTADELGKLGAAFDRMMDERVETQRKIGTENDKLSNSVVALLQAVAQLARRDLTVRVPVTEDATGPVADALNLLTGETAKVLIDVTNISSDVSAASLKVQQQADAVMGAARAEREQVEQTAVSLGTASQTMQQIARMAQDCSAAGDRAVASTQQALETVTNTVGGINNTRDMIRETEKRIKRLGERSQEISSAVNLINNIADRTHILALNAAMHAASAGEAGRGFAVVADEVQRLAENARQSTQQIAGLVNNIQVETADTANAMNAAITQVVEGARLAETAGRQMEATQKTTSELVASVQQIAQQSQVQATSAQALLVRADEIKRSTQHTSDQLSAQTEQTNLLVAYARNLLSAVRVFKLQTS